MSTIKADAITASTGTNTNIGITGKGSGKVVLGDGELIWPDADGSANQIIKTDGSKNLTFATPAAGGAWNLIGSAVASGSSTLTVTGLNDTYSTYAVAITEIRNTADSGTLRIQIGDSSGIDTGGSDYATFVEHLGGDAGTGYSASRMITNGLRISERAIGNATGESFGAMIYLQKAVGNGTFVMMHGTGASVQPDATISGGSFYGFRNAVITMTQVRLAINTNTIATGRMTVWGIAHA